MLPAGGGSRRNSANCLASGSSSSAMLAEGLMAEGPVWAGGKWPKTEGGRPNAEGGRGATMGEASATGAGALAGMLVLEGTASGARAESELGVGGF